MDGSQNDLKLKKLSLHLENQGYMCNTYLQCLINVRGLLFSSIGAFHISRKEKKRLSVLIEVCQMT